MDRCAAPCQTTGVKAVGKSKVATLRLATLFTRLRRTSGKRDGTPAEYLPARAVEPRGGAFTLGVRRDFDSTANRVVGRATCKMRGSTRDPRTDPNHGHAYTRRLSPIYHSHFNYPTTSINQDAYRPSVYPPYIKCNAALVVFKNRGKYIIIIY